MSSYLSQEYLAKFVVHSETRLAADLFLDVRLIRQVDVNHQAHVLKLDSHSTIFTKMRFVLQSEL